MKDGIFLLLGSNQGASQDNLAEASMRIEEAAGPILARSSLYRSAAWGLERQPDFYNRVLKIASNLSPEALLEKLLATELEMGRVRHRKWGPRIIDIDMLFYGSEIRDSPALHLPHPGIPGRKFTLLPLAEIAADLVHPTLNKTIAALLAECTDPLRVERIDDGNDHP